MINKIELLELLIAQYEWLIKKGTRLSYEEWYNLLREERCHLGLCFYIEDVTKLTYNEKWIYKYTQSNAYICITPSTINIVFENKKLKKENTILSLKIRLNVLYQELYHEININAKKQIVPDTVINNLISDRLVLVQLLNK